MKKIIVLALFMGLVVLVNAQVKTVPLVYGSTVEWKSIDSVSRAELNAFVGTQAYKTPVIIKAKQLISATLVHNVTSRCDTLKEQVWIKAQIDGKTKNMLFDLANLPKITEEAGILTITAYMGDSKVLDKMQKKHQRVQQLQRNPW